MRLEGKIRKEGKFWLVEIPILDYLTQGHSRKEALEMAVDIVETGVNKPNFKATVVFSEGNRFILAVNDIHALIAHMIQRWRQKDGLTVREASRRLGSKSPNAFGAYEQGKVTPSIEKLEQLLHIFDKRRDVVITLC